MTANKIFFVFSALFLLTSSLIQSQPEPAKKIICKKDGAQMVLIPKGEFIYGIRRNERTLLLRDLPIDETSFFATEFPQQIKQIPSYYIDVFEITNEQYMKFCKETKHRSPKFVNNRRWNNPKQPVVGVGWQDAEEYAKWAGKRLPTEEEWEKAARGPNGNIWPWGNISQPEIFNGKDAGYWATVNVGSYPSGKSFYGVMDMAGNVWEMTSGIWNVNTNSYSMRGGSYLNTAAYVRTMVRWAAGDEQDGATWLGFRCVMDLDKIKQMAEVQE